jgi:hypothetical protein
MKLIGNSLSVPVIEILGKAIIETGIFDSKTKNILSSAKNYKAGTNIYEEQSTNNQGLKRPAYNSKQA